MSGSVKIKWHGERVKRAIRAKAKAKLNRVGAETRNHIVKKISQGKTRISGPSAPGDPPHVDTGRLRQSIFFRVTGLAVEIGTNVFYGLYLEKGTSRMAARPFLRPSLREMAGRIKRILKG